MDRNSENLNSRQDFNELSFVEPMYGVFEGRESERSPSKASTRVSSEIHLRTINEIPEPYSKVFEAYPSFNGVQSTVFESVMYGDDSVMVTAPTGSGKTTIFELAIVKLLMNPGDGNFKIIYSFVVMTSPPCTLWISETIRIFYLEMSNVISEPFIPQFKTVAPVKALCGERFFDWEAKFLPLGVRCALVTGDTDVDGDVTDLNNLQQYDLVVTTPEKWDFLTRRWRDYQHVMNSIRLFLIDEVHILNDQSRGHVIEAVVSRMKMLRNQQHSRDRLRFIAVSATVANASDLAAWLGTTSKPAICYTFGEEMRPVALNKVVKGYDMQAMGFRFDLNLSYRVADVLKDYLEGKPALIFCSTRASVLQTAQVLSQTVKFDLNKEQKENVSAACQQISEGKLRDLLRVGIGYHHAGLNHGDRIAIENVFKAGHLPVLIATSTLAMGVNLPAHLVILKNTQFYNQGKYEEYTDSQVLQMIGRAGRPQFDSSATAVIMTRPARVARYKRLVSGSDPAKSWLQNQIIEHLNAEIVLGSVRNLSDAVEWLKSTFYWVCALKHPKQYGLPANLIPEQIEAKLQEMIQTELSELERHGLVKLIDKFETKQTSFGRIMARYYVSFDTMKLFLGMSGRETLVQLLDLLTRCSELRDVTLRMHEKRPLNDLNAKSDGGLRFRLPGKIVNRFMKINCLIQAVLGGQVLHETSLRLDSLRIMRVCQRIGRCLFEVAAEKKFMSGQRSAAILAKCLRCQLWEDSPMVAYQLPQVGIALTKVLVHARKTTLDSIANANPRELELIMNRLPPMGDNVRNAANAVAKLQVHLGRTGSDVVEVRITRRDPAIGNDHQHWFVLIVGGSDDKLLFQKRFAASDVGITAGDESYAPLSFDVYLMEPFPTKVHAFLISETWVGVDSEATLFLEELTGDAEDELYCDAPAIDVDKFYRLAETPAPKRVPKPRATPAPKKTPAPKRTPAPKKTQGTTASQKTPGTAAPKTTTAWKPSSKTNSNDIRRFFPAQKPKTATAQLSDTEEELPSLWKSYKSIFDELYKDQMESKNQQETPATVVPPKNRPVAESPQNAVTSSKSQNLEMSSDQEDDRIIDCGFEAFMAEVENGVEDYKDEVEIVDVLPQPELLRPKPRSFGNDQTEFKAEVENEDKNYEDEVEIVDGPYQPELLRPGPRSFGNDLTNMRAMSTHCNQLSNLPLKYPDDRPKVTPVKDDSEKFEEFWLNDDPTFDEVLHTPYKMSSDFIPATDDKENLLDSPTKFDEDPKSSSDGICKESSDFTTTMGHGDHTLIDRWNFDATPEYSHSKSSGFPYEKSTIDRSTIPLTNTRNVEAAPTYPFSRSDIVPAPEVSRPFTMGHRESPWSGRAYLVVASKNFNSKFDMVNDQRDDDSFMTIHRENPWCTRVNFDAAPKYSYSTSDNVTAQEVSSPFTMGHRENSWSDREKFDAAPKKSYSKSDTVYDHGVDDFFRTIHRENPRSDTANFDAAPKNFSGIYMNSKDFISTGRREMTDLPKTSYKPEVINVEDDGELVLMMGRRQVPSNQSFEKPTTLPLKDASRWRAPMYPKAGKSSEEIFPVIDSIIETAMKRSASKEKYTDFPSADEYSRWDGQDFHSKNRSDYSMDRDVPERLSTPRVGWNFDESLGIHSEDDQSDLESDPGQVPIRARIPDSGFRSITTGFGRSRNRSRERTEVNPGKGVLSEIGLEGLLSDESKNGWKENAATNHFESILSQESFALQWSSSQASKSHPSPWAKTQVQASTFSQTSPTTTRPESVTPSNRLPPIPVVSLGTPRLHRLREYGVSFRTKHVSSSFKDVVSSVKAEQHAEKRYNPFDSVMSTKKVRFDSKPKALAFIQNTNVPQSVHSVSQTLLPETWCQIAESNQKANQTIPFVTERSVDAPCESISDAPTSTMKPKLDKPEEISPDLAMALPPSPKITDPVPSYNEKHKLFSIAPEIFEPPSTAPEVSKFRNESKQHKPLSRETEPWTKPEPSNDTTIQNMKPGRSPIMLMKKPVFNVPKRTSIQNMFGTIEKKTEHTSNGVLPIKRRFKPPLPKLQ